jgi:DNA-binding NarL/FixJ family response regulator
VSITLVVVDDQATIREALAVMLDLAEDVDVLGTATTAKRWSPWSPSAAPLSS